MCPFLPCSVACNVPCHTIPCATEQGPCQLTGRPVLCPGRCEDGNSDPGLHRRTGRLQVQVLPTGHPLQTPAGCWSKQSHRGPGRRTRIQGLDNAPENALGGCAPSKGRSHTSPPAAATGVCALCAQPTSFLRSQKWGSETHKPLGETWPCGAEPGDKGCCGFFRSDRSGCSLGKADCLPSGQRSGSPGRQGLS